MPKVTHVKARKDYPAHGVLKGQMCYVWSLKTGPYSSRDFRQITPPLRSQLTTSDFLGQAYDLDDAVSKAEDSGDLSSIADDIRNLGAEQLEKLENMPEGLQSSPSGELLQERADECDAWADELERIGQEADSEMADLPDPVEGEDDDARSERWAEAISEAESACPF